MKEQLTKRLWLALVAMQLLATQQSPAQMTDLPILRDTLYATGLKEKRPLEIVLPAGYDPKLPEKYDVLYVTDGEWNTKIVTNIQQFLGIQFIPANIIVSIPNVYVDKNNMRDRDLTPSHVDGSPHSGGAGNYLSFLKDDLIPYINKKYNTSGENTLYGGSLGGLFTLYAFCKEPQLFQSYLLADPSFWWDNDYCRKLLKENLDEIKQMHKTLFIAGREGAAYQYMGIAAMDSLLRSSSLGNIRWKTMLYNDETHNSMIFRTIYDGLKLTYSGYAKEDMAIHPMGGILLKDKPIVMHCGDHELMKELHYTADGSMPTLQSPKISADTFLFGGTQLRVKSFSNREQYNKVFNSNFTEGQTLLPVPKQKNAQPGGFRYAWYEGSWDSLPDLKKLKPLQSGLADKNFDMGKLTATKSHVYVEEGQVEIKQDGYYIFAIQAEGVAALVLGNQPLFTGKEPKAVDGYKSYIVPLAKGFYPLRLTYFQKEGKPSFSLIYLVPGTNQPTPIPAELRYAVYKK